MNDSKLWFTLMNLGIELRDLDDMNRSGLLMTSTTLGHELRALDALKNFQLWLT